MTKVAKSPERHTFQAEAYVARCEENGEEPNENYLAIYKSARQQDKDNLADPKWQRDNMEYDLRSTEWICNKAKSSDAYAQNLYAAMCNREFMKNDVMPILKDQHWSASWRHAGGIVADMREQGDYIDWYCSGIGEGLGNGDKDGSKGYVSEGEVTDEIRQDLFSLGWIVVDAQDS
jgi:hypothetical protein